MGTLTLCGSTIDSMHSLLMIRESDFGFAADKKESLAGDSLKVTTIVN